MNGYARTIAPDCPNCDKPDSARHGNSSWGHSWMCCGDECGQAWGKKLESWRKRKFRPGEKAPIGGMYLVVGPRGGETGWQRAIAAGNSFPPTPLPDKFYKLLEVWR